MQSYRDCNAAQIFDASLKKLKKYFFSINAMSKNGWDCLSKKSTKTEIKDYVFFVFAGFLYRG